MQYAVKYVLEVMIIVALNLCVVGLAEIVLTVSGNNPTLKPAPPQTAHTVTMQTQEAHSLPGLIEDVLL